MGKFYTSREVIHEIYYVSIEEGLKIDELISRIASLFAIRNLIFLDTNYEIDLLALTLMRQYNLKSIFDAYYAATALNQVPDHTIISTDNIFDNVPGIKDWIQEQSCKIPKILVVGIESYLFKI